MQDQKKGHVASHRDERRDLGRHFTGNAPALLRIHRRLLEMAAPWTKVP
jgi:hypothetical protein